MANCNTPDPGLVGAFPDFYLVSRVSLRAIFRSSDVIEKYRLKSNFRNYLMKQTKLQLPIKYLKMIAYSMGCLYKIMRYE